MQLNLQNIEDVLFLDKKAQAVLPEFRPQFDQWALSKRVPGLQTMGKRILLEVLNAIDGSQLVKLEEYLSETIVLDKIDNNLVRHYQGTKNDPELCQFAGFQDFCIDVDGDNLSVTFWR